MKDEQNEKKFKILKISWFHCCCVFCSMLMCYSFSTFTSTSTLISAASATLTWSTGSALTSLIEISPTPALIALTSNVPTYMTSSSIAQNQTNEIFITTS